jgi:hypothetical protein
VLVAQPGQVVHGTAAIREGLQGFRLWHGNSAARLRRRPGGPALDGCLPNLVDTACCVLASRAADRVTMPLSVAVPSRSGTEFNGLHYSRARARLFCR